MARPTRVARGGPLGSPLQGCGGADVGRRDLRGGLRGILRPACRRRYRVLPLPAAGRRSVPPLRRRDAAGGSPILESPAADVPLELVLRVQLAWVAAAGPAPAVKAERGAHEAPVAGRRPAARTTTSSHSGQLPLNSKKSSKYTSPAPSRSSTSVPSASTS